MSSFLQPRNLTYSWASVQTRHSISGKQISLLSRPRKPSVFSEKVQQRVSWGCNERHSRSQNHKGITDHAQIRQKAPLRMQVKDKADLKLKKDEDKMVRRGRAVLHAHTCTYNQVYLGGL